MNTDILVTGIGAASALGNGIDAHRAALFSGKSGIRTVRRFDTSQLGTHLAAHWAGWDGLLQPEPSRERTLLETSLDFPLHELALVAAREALAGIELPDRSRVAIIFGTCFGQGFEEFGPVTKRIASALEISGPLITISTACSSATNAIGLGRDLLLRGHADLVLAGGADIILREAFAGFSALGVLSAEPCAPFSDPPGTTLGEGAGFVALQRASDAKKKAWASIHGYGLSADAFHETTPDPSGSGIARAIRGALKDAGWEGREIEFVSAHATGTENNDRIEWSVIERETGTPAHVSGAKGHIGHTQGAAGVLELVLALICHREGRVPPTLHFRGARTGCPPDPIANEPRTLAVSKALKLSAAFGGANAVLAYSIGDVPMRAQRERGVVVVRGAGVVGASGAHGLSRLLEVAPSVGPCSDVDLEPFGVDGRRLDRSSRWLTAAVALALGAEKREGTGLFVASSRMPAQSAKRCTESIRNRGIAGTSAAAFARMSINAPTGSCTTALGLLGPTSTFSSDESGGLLAVALAAEWLAWREDAVRMLAGSVDEPPELGPGETEGAACLALARVKSAEPGAVVIAGWGIAGNALEAVRQAMQGRAPVDSIVADADPAARAALKQMPMASRASSGMIEADSVWGAAKSTRSCVLAARGAALVATGKARSVLVVSACEASSVAVVFERVGDA